MAVAKPTTLTLGDRTIDLDRGRVQSSGGEERLTTKEVALLRYLASLGDEGAGREEIYRQVWGHADRLQTRTLDVTVLRLRRKVEPDPSSPRFVLTVPNRGYRLAGVSGVTTPRPAGQALVEVFGREGDREQLSAILRRSPGLVTVSGPGGVGKTTLARQVIADAEGPAFFCDLTEAHGAADIVRVVGEAIDVALPPSASALDAVPRIGRALSALGSGLVVLDNLEQVREAAGEVVARWLDSAPGLRVLATSRAHLKVPGEVVFELGGLAEVDAVNLFRARAARVRRGFRLDDSQLRAVVALVDALDRIPLAIELAAARVRLMSPEQILERLSQRGAALGRNPSAVPRQATLEGAIEWSWRLLAPWEQRVLSQCAVFSGGFDMPAAEAVLDAGPDAPPAIDAVQSLLEHSLLQSAPDPFDADRLRYRMLESVRQFAWARIEQEPEVCRRHALHYLALAESLAPKAESAEGARALRVEVDNLWVAAERTRTPELAARAVLSLRPLLAARGPFEPYQALVDRAVQSASSLPAATRAGLLRARGEARRIRGNSDGAMADMTAALDLACEARDRRLEGNILGGIATLHLDAGRLDDAYAHYQLALTLHRETENRSGEGNDLGNLGLLLMEKGELERCERTLNQAIEILGEVGDRRMEGNLVGALGTLAADRGDLELAERHAAHCRDSLRQVGDRRFEAVAMGLQGTIALARGQLDEAEDLFRSQIQMLRAVGDRVFLGAALGNMGLVTWRRGLLAQASDELELALREAAETGDRRLCGYFHSFRAGICALRGHEAAARQELRQAAIDAEAVGEPALLGVTNLAQAMLEVLLGEFGTARRRLGAVLAAPQSLDVRFMAARLDEQLWLAVSQADRPT